MELIEHIDAEKEVSGVKRHLLLQLLASGKERPRQTPPPPTARDRAGHETEVLAELEAVAGRNAAAFAAKTRGLRVVAEHPDVVVEVDAMGRVHYARCAGQGLGEIGPLFKRVAERAMDGADVRSKVASAAVEGKPQPAWSHPRIPAGFYQQRVWDDSAGYWWDESEEAEHARYDLAVQAVFVERATDPELVAAVRSWAPGNSKETSAVLLLADDQYAPGCEVSVKKLWRGIPDGAKTAYFPVGHQVVEVSLPYCNAPGLAGKLKWATEAAVQEARAWMRRSMRGHALGWEEAVADAATFSADEYYPALALEDSDPEAPRGQFLKKLKLSPRFETTGAPAA